MAKIKTPKGIFHYTPKALYLGIKQIDKVQALENLQILATILKTNNITWGPAFGSLLGAVREHDFIEWDEDIDLFILEEEEEMFRDCLWELQEHGFDLIRYERRGLYSIMRKGEYIDFYVFQKLTEGLRHTNGGGYIFEKYITDMQEIDFKGVPLRIPKEYDEYLTFQYGDWRKPVQYANFELSPLQTFIATAKSSIKNLLPDCIYYPLLKKHHQKDFERFKRKCQDKGYTIHGEKCLP